MQRATTARQPRPRGTVSLERALSKLGLATRSEARELILAGRVSIDGRAARDPGRAVVPERITVAIDGRSQQTPDTITIALHKPRGYDVFSASTSSLARACE